LGACTYVGEDVAELVGGGLLGSRPLGEKVVILILVVEQLVHGYPAVGQRRGHPAFLQRAVLLRRRRIVREQPFGIDVASAQAFLEVGDQ
jgi:hypothetical protein